MLQNAMETNRKIIGWSAYIMSFWKNIGMVPLSVSSFPMRKQSNENIYPDAEVTYDYDY
jgi:hypothetical protein